MWLRLWAWLPHSAPLRFTLATLGWLLFISLLHYWLNIDHSQRQIVKMGYMPVITNLAAPLLDQASKKGEGPRFQALKYASFAEMAESLRNGQIQAAFIIAPLAIVLRQQGEDVKVIYIGNRHESTLVAAKRLKATSIQDLSGKTIAVPMRYSGHNLGLKRLLAEQGMSDQVNVVEMNPPDMASALSSGALDAYFVGEPFAAQTLRSGESDLVYRVEEIWPNFICNLVLVRQDFIEKKPHLVQQLVSGAARSGVWAQKNPQQAAEIAASYWNQPKDLVSYALSTPSDRIRYDQFIPKADELAEQAQLMQRFKLSKTTEINGLTDPTFAQQVSLEQVTDLHSIFQTP